MIKFSLRCDCDSTFESWFPSGASFDRQSRSGLIECPACGSKKVAKAPMAPAVVGPGPALEAAARAKSGMREALRAMRREIDANTRDVGKNFPQEARDMHAGLIPDAAIRGQATAEEAKALIEEGVPVMPVPPLLDEMN